MSTGAGVRLDVYFRLLVYIGVMVVAISGICWILLGLGLSADDFTNPRHLWRHRLLVSHGIAAYCLLWLVGSLFPRHQRGAWRARRNRLSGSTLTLILLILAMSGLALYYPPNEEWHNGISVTHQVLGIILALALPLHAWLGSLSRPKHTFTPAKHTRHATHKS
jgi:cytochrome b subunit of formate dehydrogenase